MSDLEIEVEGHGTETLLKNCITASADIIYSVKNLKCDRRIDLEYQFSDFPNLLVQILTDILGEMEIHDILYHRAVKLELGSNGAKFTLCGHKFSRTPAVRNVIKAVTYHKILFDPVAGRADLTFDL